MEIKYNDDCNLIKIELEGKNLMDDKEIPWFTLTHYNWGAAEISIYLSKMTLEEFQLKVLRLHATEKEQKGKNADTIIEQSIQTIAKADEVLES